jgi:CspA family cold shock protein
VIGTIAWFDPVKRYGFIRPDDGGKDVFVHASAAENACIDTLRSGIRLSFEVRADRISGRPQAEALALAP